MKTLEVYQFGFDPEKSDDEIFKDRTSLILWTCIRSKHITDQYFSKKIKDVADRIKKEKPDNYFDFEKIIKSSKLRGFGQVSVHETMHYCDKKMDHEFWSDIWKAIKGKRLFKIEIISDEENKKEGDHE